MSDHYQAVYDAIRSRFQVDAQGAIESAVRLAFGNVEHWISCTAQEFVASAREHVRPSVLYRPALSLDGNQWCALYGADLQTGVAGFGASPEKAMADFDEQWAKS